MIIPHRNHAAVSCTTKILWWFTTLKAHIEGCFHREWETEDNKTNKKNHHFNVIPWLAHRIRHIWYALALTIMCFPVLIFKSSLLGPWGIEIKEHSHHLLFTWIFSICILVATAIEDRGINNTLKMLEQRQWKWRWLKESQG